MDLIPREATGATGKTVDSLNDSRLRRTEILRLFKGELPQSIMVARKSPRETDSAKGSYEASTCADRDDGLYSVFDVSSQNVRFGTAISQFPQNIGRVVLLLYTQPGQMVVDPFAGHNSRMELCVKEGRHYAGYDISTKFMDWNHQMATDLCEKYPGVTIDLTEGDSRYMTAIPDEHGDFTLTSPPYYNIEYYGDEPEQLGKAPTYAEFIDNLALVAKENYRVLKPNAFCVWFINDFRLGGKFYSYHTDVIDILTKAGFTQWDIMIVDLGTPIRAAFASQIVDEFILPKRHEYGIVMRKMVQ